jgi:hypothetical protein
MKDGMAASGMSNDTTVVADVTRGSPHRGDDAPRGGTPPLGLARRDQRRRRADLFAEQGDDRRAPHALSAHEMICAWYQAA